MYHVYVFLDGELILDWMSANRTKAGRRWVRLSEQHPQSEGYTVQMEYVR